VPVESLFPLPPFAALTPARLTTPRHQVPSFEELVNARMSARFAMDRIEGHDVPVM